MILVGMFMMVGGFIYAQDGTINMSVYNLADEKLGEEQITGQMELVIDEGKGMEQSHGAQWIFMECIQELRKFLKRKKWITV